MESANARKESVCDRPPVSNRPLLGELSGSVRVSPYWLLQVGELSGSVRVSPYWLLRVGELSGSVRVSPYWLLRVVQLSASVRVSPYWLLRVVLRCRTRRRLWPSCAPAACDLTNTKRGLRKPPSGGRLRD